MLVQTSVLTAMAPPAASRAVRMMETRRPSRRGGARLRGGGSPRGGEREVEAEEAGRLQEGAGHVAGAVAHEGDPGAGDGAAEGLFDGEDVAEDLDGVGSSVRALMTGTLAWRAISARRSSPKVR
jgi:hypothetical protein